MDIHKVYAFFMRRFRPARAAAIRDKFPLLQDSASTVLDIGGVTYPWDTIRPAAQVTILNLDPPKTEQTGQPWKYIQGDGTRLSFPDKAFDLVFSNSVIEHVGDFEAQQRFAAEMLRCGKAIYMQTPNKWFFMEPHLIAPFLHWLPFSAARRMVRWFSGWGYIAKPTQATIDTFLRTTRLLSEKEVRLLFPDCEVSRERFLGMTKSLIVTRSRTAHRAEPERSAISATLSSPR